MYPRTKISYHRKEDIISQTAGLPVGQRREVSLSAFWNIISSRSEQIESGRSAGEVVIVGVVIDGWISCWSSWFGAIYLLKYGVRHHRIIKVVAWLGTGLSHRSASVLIVLQVLLRREAAPCLPSWASIVLKEHVTSDRNDHYWKSIMVNNSECIDVLT